VIALDTNILARYFLNDDPKQGKAAAALLARKQTLYGPADRHFGIGLGAQRNGCERVEILKALRVLLGLPNFKPKQFEGALLCRALV